MRHLLSPDEGLGRPEQAPQGGHNASHGPIVFLRLWAVEGCDLAKMAYQDSPAPVAFPCVSTGTYLILQRASSGTHNDEKTILQKKPEQLACFCWFNSPNSGICQVPALTHGRGWEPVAKG